MSEDPYAHINLPITESLSSFLKRAITCKQLTSQIKLKLEQILADSKAVKFSEILEAHREMAAFGSPNLPPLWKLVKASGILLPEPYTPPRDIVVQQRIERLSQKLANADYARMTRNLTPLGLVARPRTSRFDEVRCVKRQLLMILNFLLVVIGSFIFGYFLCDITGQSYATTAQRTICGFTVALIVFIADLYFLLKNVDACEENQVFLQKKRSN